MAAATTTTVKSEAKKVLRLCSSDGKMFEVSEAAIGEASGTIKAILEEDCGATCVIPLPNVTARILTRVLKYVEKHFDDPANPHDAFRVSDDAFVDVDQDTLFDLILAANYLNIQGLLDLTCKTVADQMRGKTTDELREHFNIVNDYTKEEEEEVCRENSWAFE